MYLFLAPFILIPQKTDNTIEDKVIAFSSQLTGADWTIIQAGNLIKVSFLPNVFFLWHLYSLFTSPDPPWPCVLLFF